MQFKTNVTLFAHKSIEHNVVYIVTAGKSSQCITLSVVCK